MEREKCLFKSISFKEVQELINNGLQDQFYTEDYIFHKATV